MKRKFSKILGIGLVLALLVSLLLMVAMPVAAAKPVEGTTIQDGILTYSAGHYLEGELLQTGFDSYGYNYQAHQFNGSYANSYLGKDGFPPYEGDAEAYLAANEGVDSKWYWQYRDVQLMMKWSDPWLSNKDCDNDELLDRGDEGAWLTNHQSGWNDDGTHWFYFVKIVYPPGGVVDGNSDGIDDNTGGSVIWTNFIRTQQVSNDPAFDEHGLLFMVQPAGFGAYK